MVVEFGGGIWLGGWTVCGYTMLLLSLSLSLPLSVSLTSFERGEGREGGGKRGSLPLLFSILCVNSLSLMERRRGGGEMMTGDIVYFDIV